jgi:F0F1-type ATP synthase gamma subunit
MSNRTELESSIEREVHKLVSKISDHTYDFVNTYVRRNNVPVEYPQMEEILKIVKMAIADGHLKQVDFFHEGIKSTLDRSLVENDEVPFTKTLQTSAMKQEEDDGLISFSTRH